MIQPTLFEIDQIRNEGFRPQVVGCFLNNKKILFLYKKKYNLWQFPQGGIDNGETIEIAFFREMIEELGEEFVKSCDKKILLIGNDKIAFPAYSQNSRELKNDKGQNISMRGKKYFFIYVESKKNIDISNSEFNDFKWTSYEEGLDLCEKIYQLGKKRILVSALNKLHEINLL